MKPSIYRRIRRRTASQEVSNTKKENKQDSFFGDVSTEPFFQPALVATQPVAVNRKCAECEQEDKKVQRLEDKKEEDKKLQRMTDKKEEEKLQRQPDKKEEEKLMKKDNEKEEDKIQKKESGSNTPISITSSYISSLNSKGTSLPKQSQQFFGSRMGYDFSQIKVHTDQEAAQSAKEVNAKAYTTGEHIVFNEGQYDTNSAEGKKLMAHELTHVVQQNKESGKIQRVRGMRPPPRRPTGPPRGRFGQLPGQRLPPRKRNLPTETFERREQRRAEEAHQQFLQAIKRNQQWLEKWGREGSEPKTAAQKAFTILVKILEVWDEYRNAWDETHKKFEQALRDREYIQGVQNLEVYDRKLIELGVKLKELDKEMFIRLHNWQVRMDKWLEWYNRVYITPSNAHYLIYDLAILIWDANIMGQYFAEKARKIYYQIPISYSHLINPNKGPSISAE